MYIYVARNDSIAFVGRRYGAEFNLIMNLLDARDDGIRTVLPVTQKIFKHSHLGVKIAAENNQEMFDLNWCSTERGRTVERWWTKLDSGTVGMYVDDEINVSSLMQAFCVKQHNWEKIACGLWFQVLLVRTPCSCGHIWLVVWNIFYFPIYWE